MLDFFNILTYVDIFYFLCVTVFMLLHIKKLPLPLKVFSFFFAAMFILGLSTFIMSLAYMRNTSLFPLFLFIQLAWFTVFYYQLFSGTKTSLFILLASAACTIGFIAEYVKNWHNIKEQLGGTLYFISNVLFVAFAVLYYAISIGSTQKLKYPLINAAVLIYFSGTSVVFLFGNYLSTIELSSQVMVWIFNVLLHIVFLTLINIEAWKVLHKNRIASSAS